MLGYINSKLPDFELSSTNVAGLAAVTAGATVAFCVVSRALSYFAKQSRENQELKDRIKQQESVFAEINSRIASLETQNTTKTEEIRILEAGIQSLTHRIRKLEFRVRVLENQRLSKEIKSLKLSLKDLSDRIVLLESEIISKKIMRSPSFLTNFPARTTSSIRKMIRATNLTKPRASSNSHTLPNSSLPTTPPPLRSISLSNLVQLEPFKRFKRFGSRFPLNK